MMRVRDHPWTTEKLQALLWTRPLGMVTILVTVMGKHRIETVSVLARWDAKRD